VTSQQKSGSGRGTKKPLMMAFLPLDRTDEELQRFADFLNGESKEASSKPAQPPPKPSNGQAPIRAKGGR
jgi:hypothetical protein